MPTAVALRVVAILATVLVGVLLLIPLPAPPPGFGPPEPDKLAHLVLFGILAALWSVAIRPARFVAVGLAVTFYGGLLELLQGLTSYRDCDLRDFAADALGAAIAVGLLGALGAWQTLRR